MLSRLRWGGKYKADEKIPAASEVSHNRESPNEPALRSKDSNRSPTRQLGTKSCRDTRSAATAAVARTFSV